MTPSVDPHPAQSLQGYEDEGRPPRADADHLPSPQPCSRLQYTSQGARRKGKRSTERASAETPASPLGNPHFN